jgi:hypothetical protein
MLRTTEAQLQWRSKLAPGSSTLIATSPFKSATKNLSVQDAKLRHALEEHHFRGGVTVDSDLFAFAP